MLALSGLLCLCAVSAARAGGIDTIEIDATSEPARIRVNLTRPLEYINHAPETQGQELQIQLRTITAAGLLSDGTENQTVAAPDSGTVPLLDVSYDQNTLDRGVVTLRFRHSVRYEVQAGADRRHLIILVQTPGADKPPTATVPADTAKPAAPAGSETPSMFVLGGNRYIVNLESSTRAITLPTLDVADPGQYFVYTAQFEIDKRTWYRLRAGFFASRSDARLFVEAIKHQYPRAWVAFADNTEVSAALEQIGKAGMMIDTPARPEGARDITPTGVADAATQDGIAAETAQTAAESAVIQPGIASTSTPVQPTLKAVPAIMPTLPEAEDEHIKALMEEARQAMAQNKYQRAIQLYTKILQYPDHAYARDALEYLGVARERNGQVAHAINEYQRYLTLYPDGDGANRIRQRLAGLTTAAERPRPSSRRPEAKDAAIPWQVYGGISQFYRRNESSTDGTGDIVTDSSLSSDLDVTARKRGQRYDFQSRFTGSYLYDFLSDGFGDRSSVSSLYFDAKDKRRGISMRLGRQSRNTGGVLGRFDGLLAGYQLNDRVTINAVGGFPVESTRDQVDTDKYLYGISADLGTFANAWDFNVFIIEQQAENILDRRAVGGEARYFDPTRSLLTFVDYDISYDSLNTAIFLGTWTLPDRTTINASVDHRNSPILTTTSALQGQTVRTIDELLDNFSEQELRDLAEDRTGESTTATLGASHPFSERIQLSGDVTVANLKGTDASGGVEAIPDTGNEYFYNLQLIGSGLLTSGDISIFGLRYANTSTAGIYSVLLNSRYPVNSDWRVNPRLRIDYRENDRDDSTQWITAPSLRVDYRLRKRLRLELEGGGEWSTRRLSDDNEDSSSWYFSAGYRLDF